MTGTRSSRAAIDWSSPGPARGRIGRPSSVACWVWKVFCRWAFADRPTTSGAGPSISTRAASTRYWASNGCSRRSSPGIPTTRSASPCRRSSRYPRGQVVTNDYAQMTLDLSTQWSRVPPRGGARSVSGGAAAGDGRGDGPRLPGRQQRCLPLRFRRGPGGLRQGLRPAVRPAGLAHRAAGQPAIPDGRHHHRGRRPALHHAGPVRRRLPRPFQVQPQQAHRNAGAVGLRARPVPDAGFWRHHRLRSRSRSTTTWCTPTSIRRRSSRRART